MKEEIILPKKNLLDVNLKEIWQYKDLLFLFVRRDFVAIYKQTILGPLWFIIQPVFTTLMFTLIFGKLASIPTDGLPPILFTCAELLAGIIFQIHLQKPLTPSHLTQIFLERSIFLGLSSQFLSLYQIL